MTETATITVVNVLYFLAEAAVYVFLFWWGITREVSSPLKLVLAIALVSVFALAWGVFASPGAMLALPGVADLIFRVVWFAAGAAAAIGVLGAKWT